MPSIHSSVSTSLAVRSQSTCGTRKSVVSGAVFGEFRSGGGFETEIHLHLDAAGQRVDDFDRLQPARFARTVFGERRGEIHVAEIAAETPLDAGPQHLDGDFARAVCVAHQPLCTCAIEAAAIGSPRFAKIAVERPAERCLDRRHGDVARKRRHAVLQQLEMAHDLRADDIRPRRQKLAELHIGGAERGDRGGQIGEARAARRALRRASPALAAAGRPAA